MDFFSSEFISPLLSVFLIVLAGFTSFLTAALGAGGGLLLLVAMASFMPMAAVIPVHGLVQLGSNANRMLLTFRHIDKNMLIYFTLGGLVGALVSSFVVHDLPLDWMKLAVGGFVLFLLWGKKPSIKESSPLGKAIAGLVTTFLSMFVGASGPLVGSYLHTKGYEKMRFTATFSASMTMQHTLKAIVYATAGFAFWQWMPLVIAMIGAGAIGTWLGLKLLHKIPAARFQRLVQIVLSVLSINLMYQAIDELFF
ncbi:sulfite exporter TauE/SafE family protein [Paraglaciecola sp. 20A4]|uniref:sulfite exporter TauE/SafE family protein n=1 Tax=Paraglaciecola sp. 20A4 TaxID=2687288 RepID=UPI0014099E47|nr:sulfite exporter TauE/SafE family protein [Paraglaciecola sp. 20A4]